MFDEPIAEIREILTKALKINHEAILTTVDPKGKPHAAWMGAFCTHDFEYMITVTSLRSDKVDNIRQNPSVEWMFTSADRKKVIYFEGNAEILVDERLKQQYFGWVPDETKGFFMKYYRNGGDWVVIRTRLESVVYCMPGAYTKVRLGMDQVRGEAVEV